jgi:hypothetical protein
MGGGLDNESIVATNRRVIGICFLRITTFCRCGNGRGHVLFSAPCRGTVWASNFCTGELDFGNRRGALETLDRPKPANRSAIKRAWPQVGRFNQGGVSVTCQLVATRTAPRPNVGAVSK